MHLSPARLYALRLTLNQGATSSMLRKDMAERSTTKSALFLATIGLSMSMFSLKQMLSSPANQQRLRRLH